MPTDPAAPVTHLANDAYRDNWAPLRRFLARRLGNAQDVDDLAQEVFARLLRVNDVELVRNPLAYLLGIAKHVVCEFKQRGNNNFVIFDSNVLESAGETIEDDATTTSRQHELREDIDNALLNLPPTHRLVFLLVKRDGLSYTEAAEVTGLSIHTIQKYLAEARARLRVALMDTRRQP